MHIPLHMDIDNKLQSSKYASEDPCKTAPKLVREQREFPRHRTNTGPGKGSHWHSTPREAESYGRVRVFYVTPRD